MFSQIRNGWDLRGKPSDSLILQLRKQRWEKIHFLPFSDSCQILIAPCPPSSQIIDNTAELWRKLLSHEHELRILKLEPTSMWVTLGKPLTSPSAHVSIPQVGKQGNAGCFCCSRLLGRWDEMKWEDALWSLECHVSRVGGLGIDFRAAFYKLVLLIPERY